MAKDLLKLQRAPELNLRTLLRPAVFVPESQGPERAAARLPLQPQPPGDRHRRVRQHRRPDHDRGRARGDRRRDRGRVRRAATARAASTRWPTAASAWPATPTIAAVNEAFGVAAARPTSSTPSAAWSRTSSAACRGAARRSTIGGLRLHGDADARRRGALVQGVAARRERRSSRRRPDARAPARAAAPRWPRWLGLVARALGALQTLAFVAHGVRGGCSCCVAALAGAGARGAAAPRGAARLAASAPPGSAPASGGCSSACTATAACRRWLAALAVLRAGRRAVAVPRRGHAPLFARWRRGRAAGATRCCSPRSGCSPSWRAASLFTGFPWVASGYAHVDSPLAAAGAVARRLRHRRVVAGAGRGARLRAGCGAAPRAGWRRWRGCCWRRWRSALAAGRVDFTRPAGALSVYAAAGQRRRRTRSSPPSTCPQALAWLGRAAARAHAATLVVAPETAIPLLPDAARRRPGTGTALRAALSRGRPRRRWSACRSATTSAGYTNSVVGLAPRRRPRPYRYDKHHLVPFGEFIPTGFRWFTEMMNIPLGDFNRGAAGRAVVRRRPASASRPTSATRTCSARSWRRASPTRRSAPTIFANLSNIGWFGDTIAIDQHLQISRMRALEFAAADAARHQHRRHRGHRPPRRRHARAAAVHARHARRRGRRAAAA